MKKPLLPADFKTPLLLAIAKQSDWQAGKPVAMVDLFKPVCDHMSIEEQEYGLHASGKLQTHKWIQWAFKTLKRDGLGESSSRGRWGLTAEGMAKARELSSHLTPKAPAAPSGEVVAPPSDPSNLDPDLLRVVVANTPCVGWYSEKSKTCRSCYISTPCKETRHVNFAGLELRLKKTDKELAEKLAREKRAKEARLASEEARRAAAEKAAKQAKARTETNRGTGVPQHWWQEGDTRYINAVFSVGARGLLPDGDKAATCPICNKEVKDNTLVTYAKRTKAEIAVFHRECATTANMKPGRTA